VTAFSRLGLGGAIVPGLKFGRECGAGAGGKSRDVAGKIGIGSDASRHYRDTGPGSDAKRRASERPLFKFCSNAGFEILLKL